MALATPLASSAIAVLRTSGQGSLEILSGLVKGRGSGDGEAVRGGAGSGDRGAVPGGAGSPDLAASSGHTLHHCVIHDGDEPVDDVLISVFKAPRSYTGEDSAEISCHGSLPVIRRLVSLLNRSGFRQAGPGEFTQRAFLNGKMDLTRAEAVNEIVRARTDRARGLALQRLSGAIEGKIHEARDALLDLRASIEVQLDYPDEETEGGALDPRRLDNAEKLLGNLVRSYARGRIYQEGVTVAIAGATNSGKSSLFNLLLKQERAIVSEIHGTTRDWLEGTLSIEGIPVRLFDTAGIRDTRDPLEAEGIRRTEEVVSGADVILYIVDSEAGVSAGDEAFLGSRSGAPIPVLKIWNKTDLPSRCPLPEGFLPLSARTGAGIPDLEKELVTVVLRGTSEETGEPLIDSERQKDLIGRALDSIARFRQDLGGRVPLDLAALDVADALDALGEITGEVTSAEVLERMFSRFCVGK